MSGFSGGELCVSVTAENGLYFCFQTTIAMTIMSQEKAKRNGKIVEIEQVKFQNSSSLIWSLEPFTFETWILFPSQLRSTMGHLYHVDQLISGEQEAANSDVWWPVYH